MSFSWKKIKWVSTDDIRCLLDLGPEEVLSFPFNDMIGEMKTSTNCKKCHFPILVLVYLWSGSLTHTMNRSNELGVGVKGVGFSVISDRGSQSYS